VSLPLYPGMPPAAVDRVCDTIASLRTSPTGARAALR